MKGVAIDQLVYQQMFPRPKSTDPQSFQGLLQRQLVPEVRLETQAFYGHLSSQEAKYPGLDYSYPPHRVRLSRYQWHRRLFRALDYLELTVHEIASLTKWEGTRWAKERFEREQAIVIRDTTGDGIADWVEPEARVPVTPQTQRPGVEDMDDIQENVEAEEDDIDDDGEDSEPEIQSIGLDLNTRLLTAAAERNAGNAGTVMDEEWEQWLKEAAEAGGLPFSDVNLSPNASIPGTRPAGVERPAPLDPRLLSAARTGQWHEIPDFLHNMVRHNIEAQNRQVEGAANTPATSSSSSSTSTRPSTVSPLVWGRSLAPRASASSSSAANPERMTSVPTPRPGNAVADQFPHLVSSSSARPENNTADQLSRRPIPNPQAAPLRLERRPDGRLRFLSTQTSGI